MRSITGLRFLPIERFALLSGIIIVLSASNHQHYVSCTMSEEEMWSKYRPVAMDESWALVNGKPSYSETLNPTYSETVDPTYLDNGKTAIMRALTKKNPSMLPKDIVVGSKPIMVKDRVAPAVSSVQTVSNEPIISSTGSDLVDLEQWKGKEVKDTLFRLPARETSSLTKIITGDQTPTFMDEELKMPISLTPAEKSKDRILARYRLIVPIFVPAIKLKKKATPKPPPIKFVREQVTEMMPIKQMVPHVKEVIKAERVPQQLVVDYVRENRGKAVPGSVDDKVKSGETLVSSVVRNFD